MYWCNRVITFCCDMKEILSVYHKRYADVELIVKTNYVDELIEMMIHNEVDFIFVIDRPLYHKRMGKTLYEKRRNFIFAHYENDLVKKGESKHTRNIKTTFYINRKRD